MRTEAFGGKRILVAGEAILDRYVSGAAERISREAPVPVLSSSAEF
ncbi:MAG: D-glycero-beta-D-manno-heptose-7-phosphate kinase, partial [Betaproteobacteria bacterium AqS2]|nr:D-glycero-beta-D-manno-heptose-7-phosphate kinase [Betaproteobacteria bacterium AqS2]